ncbi:large ribosomal subunit protein mL55 [Rhynchocyon petersi]
MGPPGSFPPTQMQLSALGALPSNAFARYGARLPLELQGGMAAVSSLSGLLRQSLLQRSGTSFCHLHTSVGLADCNRASFTRLHRQAYARLYPVLLVKQDGATIHIRYREPRRILMMPIDLDSLSPEERKARLRKREAKFSEKKVEPEIKDDFDVEQYKRFWTKK